MKAFGEAVGLLIALLIILWGALIYYAEPDRKPIMACKPVYFFTSGVQTTAAAASSTQQNSNKSTQSHVATMSDGSSGKSMTVADRFALGCLRFTDRLFNK